MAELLTQRLQSKMQRQIFIMMTDIYWLHNTNDNNYFFNVKFLQQNKSIVI